MGELFSRRHRPPPDELRYDVPNEVRERIFALLEHLERAKKLMYLDQTLNELHGRLLAEYGTLRASGYEAARVSKIPIVEHFFSCDDDEALDFIELMFRVEHRRIPHLHVDEINRIFREEGVGYELTQLTIKTGKDAKGETLPLPVYPQIIRKSDDFTHEHVIKPALTVLRSPAFAVANAEMLRAHEELRRGQDADAITDAGAAFESVLKTICDRKGWTYDPEKDTTAKLVGICLKHGLFPSFYAPMLEAAGTVRNKLGDAHGRGPAERYEVRPEHAEHLVQMVSAHIVLLAKLAGI